MKHQQAGKARYAKMTPEQKEELKKRQSEGRQKYWENIRKLREIARDLDG